MFVLINHKTQKKIHGMSKSDSKREVIAIQTYLKKQEQFQINNLKLHLKELEKEESTKPKVSGKKERMKSEQKYTK